MGSRAHYVLVRNGSWELYYSQWGAEGLALDLAPGPVSATHFIEEQVRRDRWMDDVWCEGVALVDHDKRVLLFQASMYEQDFVQRACFFRVLLRTWPGWQVRWDSGLREVRAYVGDPAMEPADTNDDHVASVFPDPGKPIDEYMPIDSLEDLYADVKIITVEDDNGVAAYAVRHGFLCHLLDLGPALTGRLFRRLEEQHLPVVPEGGLHIDTVQRRISGWTLPIWHPSTEEITARWPGWTWTSWEDRFWEQARAARGALIFPESDLRRGYAWLHAAVQEHPHDNPAAYLRARVDELRSEGNEVLYTGPGALAHTAPGPTLPNTLA